MCTDSLDHLENDYHIPKALGLSYIILRGKQSRGISKSGI